MIGWLIVVGHFVMLGAILAGLICLSQAVLANSNRISRVERMLRLDGYADWDAEFRRVLTPDELDIIAITDEPLDGT